ncbi:hypothetical protein [Cytobacillus oceanisediminis]|uniref:Uncharacterized protein n=1 Tax=Cytobacillus oceanisediminis 2691 TaxID=1196031 RepID=A0A160MCR0_9BACI|nr:hypothetical protein [Cytobacillus oceanisediminis]AND40777.1 hypothetical protein A361_17000 [Cytobacillus oceanisediminis 2691]
MDEEKEIIDRKTLGENFLQVFFNIQQFVIAQLQRLPPRGLKTGAGKALSLFLEPQSLMIVIITGIVTLFPFWIRGTLFTRFFLLAMFTFFH